MHDETTPPARRQGSAHPWRERLPLPPTDAMTEPQRVAAQALIDGPRKGVYGPFLPLLRSPELLDRVGRVGEYLRFQSVLDARGLASGSAVGRLPASEQRDVVLAIVRRELGVMTAAALVALVLALRAAGTAGLFG